MYYRVEVQLKPQVTSNGLQFYWRVYQITEEGQFTVKDGFNHRYSAAWADASEAGRKFL